MSLSVLVTEVRDGRCDRCRTPDAKPGVQTVVGQGESPAAAFLCLPHLCEFLGRLREGRSQPMRVGADEWESMNVTPLSAAEELTAYLADG